MTIELVDASECKEPYSDSHWGIKQSKIWELQELFEQIKEKYPDLVGLRSEHESLGDQLLGTWHDLVTFNIPIDRKDNGIDFDLTTDTGRVIGHGQFLEKLKDVSIEKMDYHLSEVDGY